MKNKDGVIFLRPDFTEWKWFHNAKIVSVYLWLLASANLEDGSYEKDEVPRGSLVTNNNEIAYECGLTIQNVRTALNCLARTGEIKRAARNHYQIITITDFDKLVPKTIPKG